MRGQWKAVAALVVFGVLFSATVVGAYGH